MGVQVALGKQHPMVRARRSCAESDRSVLSVELGSRRGHSHCHGQRLGQGQDPGCHAAAGGWAQLGC